MQQQPLTPRAEPPAGGPLAAAETPPPLSPRTAPLRRRRRGPRAATPSSWLPSLVALLHALALSALVVYECIVGFPLARDWRESAAAAAGGGSNGPAAAAGVASLGKEADALWWLTLVDAGALLLFLVLGLVARAALALGAPPPPPPPPDRAAAGGAAAAAAAAPRARFAGPRARPLLPRHVFAARPSAAPAAPATTAASAPPPGLRRRLLLAAAWLPAGLIAAADFARLCVLASGNNKRRLAASPGGGDDDCAAGPTPQDETRAAFHPASPGGLDAPTCDRFRMAVVLAVVSVCFVVLSLLWRATPRRPLSRLLLAPLLAVAATALLLAKPVTSLMLFVYVQREAFARSTSGGDGGGGGGGGGGGAPGTIAFAGGGGNGAWIGEAVLALISLLLAALGAAFVLAAALALGAPWAVCAAAERCSGCWGGGGAEDLGGGGKRPAAAPGVEPREEEEEGEGLAAPPQGAPAFSAASPAPEPYAPGARAPPDARRPRGLLATLAALLAVTLLAAQLPAAFGLIAPVVALSSFPSLWGNFWVALDFALGVAGVALFALAVLAALARLAAAPSGGRGDEAAAGEGEGTPV
jgi:hypothetical protein